MLATFQPMSEDNQEIENHLRAEDLWDNFMIGRDEQEGKARQVWLYVFRPEDFTYTDFFVGFSGHAKPSNNGFLWYRLFFTHDMGLDERIVAVKLIAKSIMAQWESHGQAISWNSGQPEFN